MRGVVFRKPDGTPISSFALLSRIDKQARATCPHCGQSWDVFASPDQMAILGLVNTRRTAVPGGYDDHDFDNRSNRRIPMNAPLRLSRYRLERLEVQWEAAKTTGVAGRFSRPPAEIALKIEQSLKTSLAMTTESGQALEQTVNAEIPPGRRLIVRVHWKQIWEEGDLKVRLPDGTVAEVPYRAAVEKIPSIQYLEG
jgi:hypothetical protein